MVGCLCGTLAGAIDIALGRLGGARPGSGLARRGWVSPVAARRSPDTTVPEPRHQGIVVPRLAVHQNMDGLSEDCFYGAAVLAVAQAGPVDARAAPSLCKPWVPPGDLLRLIPVNLRAI